MVEKIEAIIKHLSVEAIAAKNILERDKGLGAITKIYVLICPLDGDIKYVGKSNNPDKRLKDHLLDFRCMDLHKAKWLRLLKDQKQKPILVVIDEVGMWDWKFWEEWWCTYIKSLGYTLFNKRSKNGLTYANSKTFKPGNRPWNYGIKKSSPDK